MLQVLAVHFENLLVVTKNVGHLPYASPVGGGDGLDSRARVDAKLMGDLLSYAQQSPCWSDFLRSLPEVGVDGTMKRRGLPGVTAYAKTGTLATTRTLAGYVRHRSGRLLSVYGAVWGKSAMPGARAFLDGILLWGTNAG